MLFGLAGSELPHFQHFALAIHFNRIISKQEQITVKSKEIFKYSKRNSQPNGQNDMKLSLSSRIISISIKIMISNQKSIFEKGL